MRKISQDVFGEWDKFENFYKWCIENGWQKGLLFSRIDLEKGFYPENCKFKTYAERSKENHNYEKTKQTNLKRHGYEHSAQCPEIKAKQHATNMERYGSISPASNPEVQKKIKAKCLEKYGVENVFSDKEFYRKALQARIDKYGTLAPKSKGKTEKSIRDWLNSFGFNFVSDKSILNGYEIDMYDESLKLGIEYCGLYWHHEGCGKKRSYHYSKMFGANAKGVRLITIFSDEWKCRKSQVMNFLRSVIGKNDRNVYARKCELSQIDTEVATDFINQHHIQELKRISEACFSLKFDDELVAALSLNRHHRKTELCVLDRLCFKENCNVVGGASRLVKLASEWAKNRGFDKIISWSDNRWSEGKIYEKLGFVLDGELGPDYSYINIQEPNKRYSKQSMKKSRIECPTDQTEKEFLSEQGFYRVWDCGKKRWILYL